MMKSITSKIVKTFPMINYNDIICSYKERVFSGFAPCFQNGIYSLACCKGARNGHGMRQSICKAIESGNRVWVLAIAGGDITTDGNNRSGIDYAPGDAIYLAKIDRVCTWYEYSTSDIYSKRDDSYYVLKNGKVDWRAKKEGLHDTEEHKLRDCAIGSCSSKGRSEEDVFKNDKQILIADEYYVFEKGQKLSGIRAYEDLDALRGFKYYDYGLEQRSVVLQKFLQKNNSFAYCSGEDPFKNAGKSKRSGCK